MAPQLGDLVSNAIKMITFRRAVTERRLRALKWIAFSVSCPTTCVLTNYSTPLEVHLRQNNLQPFKWELQILKGGLSEIAFFFYGATSTFPPSTCWKAPWSGPLFFHNKLGFLFDLTFLAFIKGDSPIFCSKKKGIVDVHKSPLWFPIICSAHNLFIIIC